MAENKISLLLGQFFLVCLLVSSIPAFSQLTDFEEVDFSKADSIANYYKGEDLDNLPELAFLLTADLDSDVEKFRSLFVWVCRNISYDHSMYSTNKRHRERYSEDTLALVTWNQSIRDQMMQKLVSEKKTVCTGYAYLLMELCQMVDIPCRIIDGYGRTATANVRQLGIPNHSWNAVQLNSKWYLCDPTWSGGIVHLLGQLGVYFHDFHDGYFLADPDFFLRNHYPLDSRWTLTDTASLAEFLSGPVVYSDAFKYGMNPIGPNDMDLTIQKKDTLSFVFKGPAESEADRIYFELDFGSGSRTVEPLALVTQGENLEVLYYAAKTGFYDLHLKLNDDVLMTYTLKVKR